MVRGECMVMEYQLMSRTADFDGDEMNIHFPRKFVFLLSVTKPQF